MSGPGPGAVPLTVGLDIGGTSTAAVLMNGGGVVLSRTSLPSGYGPARVLEVALDAVAGVCEQAGVGTERLTAVGVGIPGSVGTDDGHVRHAVNLGIDSVDVAGLLGARLRVPVRIENDVNVAALGSFHLLGAAGRAPGSLCYLNLGTGLACGIVLDGRLWRGSSGVAGEIGHVPVDPDGVPCACGQRGCLETVCSASAVARLWPTASEPPPVALFRAADGGDPSAQAIRDQVLEGVAAAVRLVTLTVDLDVVALGGGLSRLGEPLLAGVRAALARMGRPSAFLSALDLPARVVLAAQPEAATLGAALLGREILGRPA